MARYRRRRGRNRAVLPAILVVGACGLAWWWYPDAVSDVDGPEIAGRRVPVLSSDRPETEPASAPRPGISEKGDAPTATTAEAKPDAARARELLSEGRKALTANDWIAARAYINQAIAAGLDGAELDQARADLTRINMETVFSPRVLPDDRLVQRYIIQSGDSLAAIAKEFDVSADFLADINGIKNKNLIRAGQTIKVVQGPFHAEVDAAKFTLTVYIGEERSRTFMKQFSVGLGADGSTPRGTWKVRNKLVDPTYYPPRGGSIIAADDPENPLGERWIGLEGVAGEAVGQQRYGIHGTIEPDSIGRNASMGCIRLYNEDAEELYDLLIPGKSLVHIR